jgi:hypothetical protein
MEDVPFGLMRRMEIGRVEVPVTETRGGADIMKKNMKRCNCSLESPDDDRK